MNSSIITQLIEELQSKDSISGVTRSQLLDILRTQKERTIRDQLIESLEKIGRVDTSEKDWRRNLADSFESIGGAIKADRICYYEAGSSGSEEKSGFSLRVEWADQEVCGTMETAYPFLPDEEFSDMLVMFQNRCPIQTVRSHQHDGILKKLMTDDQINTILLIPIYVKNSLYGMLRFDDCQSERVWSDLETSLLQTTAFQIRNLFEKHEMEKQLLQTYRQAGIGTWEMDLENDTFEWSAVTKEIFEVDPETVPNREVAFDIFHDDRSRQQIFEAVERAQNHGEPYDIEVLITTAKGNERWIRDTGQPQIKNGKCVRLFGVVQDIHKRKMAELESEKNKKLLESITQQTEVAVWVRDQKGEILFVNNEWKKIFGLSDQRISGKTLFEFLDKENADEMVESDRMVIQSGNQIVFEEMVDTVYGKRHYMVNKFPLTGIAGLENAVGGIGTDITNIKETEEKLQHAEQKLREIIEHSTNLFYTHDADHNLTYLSPQSIDFLGYPPEEAKRRWTEFVTEHPVNEKGMNSTQTAIDTGRAQPPFELQLKRGDDKIIWVEVNEAPVVKNGQTISVAGSLTNITERKKAQESIRSNLKEKETLLAEIHHRVKNNLAVVASLMQLQAMESDSTEVRGQLIESVLRIKSMASIHEHLYKAEIFSKLDFAENVKSLVREVIETMQYSSDISLKFKCDEVYLNINQAIPCSLILNEVITNIIKHAFKDLDKGEISLQLHQNADIVAITVKDNGHGLPEGFNQDTLNTLGMQLIKTLSGQLSADYRYQSLDNGTEFTLQFGMQE